MIDPSVFSLNFLGTPGIPRLEEVPSSFLGILAPPPFPPGTVHGEFTSLGNFLFVPVHARVGTGKEYLPKFKNLP